MEKTLYIFIVLLAIPVLLCAQAENDKFSFTNYEDMRAYFGELYNEGKYEEGARLLEWALDKFPDNLMANSFNLALVCARLGHGEKGVEVLMSALDKDVWFSIYAFDHELFDPLREQDVFDEFLARNKEKIQEVQKNTFSKYSVVLPESYDKEKPYPLFIALHGGGGNMEEFKDRWKSTTLSAEFIQLFVQSSRIVALNGYSWTEDLDISKKEIKNAYNEVMRDYIIKEDEVIIGGFSSGGVASLDIALCNTMPVAGFVVLCPAKPESFTDENVKSMTSRDLCGTILTTEMDPRLDSQKEMDQIMRRAGFDCRLLVTPNIGHWFPEDLDVQIDKAIAHIRE
jgi:predicted esterase